MSGTPTTGEVSELAGVLTGAVILRGESGFDEELATFNTSVVHTPFAVVCAESVADVQATVRFATAHGIAVGVHSTGHGYTSFTEGIMVSMRRLDSLEIDPERHLITVGAGVRWHAVLEAAAPLGLAPLAGSSTDVGVVGYSLGGGLSIMGRAFGMGVDQVHALEVVMMDGEVRQVDAHSEPDLFWGLRGGGCNLGVVTRITVELVAVTEFYGGGIYFDGAHMRDILIAYGEWTQSIPDEMCTSLAMIWMPPSPAVPEPLRGRVIAHLRVCYLGEGGSGDEMLAPMRAVAPALIDHVSMIPVTNLDAIHGDPPEPIPFYLRGTLLREVTAQTADALLSIVGADVQVPMLLWDLRHQQGAFARIPEHAAAISGRDAAFNLQVVGLDLPEASVAVHAVVDAATLAMDPWSTGETILNVHGAVKDEADRRRAFDDVTYERLVGLVHRYDPQGLLRHGHSIARAGMTAG